MPIAPRLSTALILLTLTPACGDDGGGDPSEADTDGGSDGADEATTAAPINVAPQAADDEYFARQDEPLTVVAAEGMFANDADDDPLALQAADPTSEAGATIAAGPDGGFTYTPVPGFWGVDTFLYSITDPFGEVAMARVRVHVAPAAASLGAMAPGVGGFAMPGPLASGWAGVSVAGIGDVNGDGLDDVMVGAPFLEFSPGFEQVSDSYVVFGRADGSIPDLTALGDGGFVVRGAEAGDQAGMSVAGAGDVNGDGLDDFIVGAPSGFYQRAYVVFGRVGNADIDLASLGQAGFVIESAWDYDGTGTSVAGAGDVNGDGLDDVIVGAPNTYVFGELGTGRAYVVFGKNDSEPVLLETMYDLALPSPDGFAIGSPGDQEVLAGRVAGAGDVNGDGFDDVIVGSPAADPGGFSDAGRAYVVFGRADTTAVHVSALGNGGFAIEGDAVDAFTGVSVAGAGDIDGDGLADVIVGATTRTSESGIAGRAFVVYGKTDTLPVSVARLGDEGITIGGGEAGDFAGASVAAAGDVNGDGIDDLVVGATAAYVDGMSGAGRSYVVYGAPGKTAVKLSMLGAGGFSLDGEALGDGAGLVAGAGDFNGDGLADVLVGAPWRDTTAGSDAGQAYLVFGVRTQP